MNDCIWVALWTLDGARTRVFDQSPDEDKKWQGSGSCNGSSWASRTPSSYACCLPLLCWFCPWVDLWEHHGGEYCLFWGAGKRVKKWLDRGPRSGCLFAVDPAFDRHWRAPRGVCMPSVFILSPETFCFFPFFRNGHPLSVCLTALNSAWCDLGTGGVGTTSRPVSCLGGSDL